MGHFSFSPRLVSDRDLSRSPPCSGAPHPCSIHKPHFLSSSHRVHTLSHQSHLILTQGAAPTSHAHSTAPQRFYPKCSFWSPRPHRISSDFQLFWILGKAAFQTNYSIFSKMFFSFFGGELVISVYNTRETLEVCQEEKKL